MRLAILVTCHNRVNTTVRGLTKLVEALSALDGLAWDLFVVDDGSRDGTAESVAASIPKAQIVRGNGELYWNGGMQVAYEFSLSVSSYSAYLLFNDDVFVDDIAIKKFFIKYRELSTDRQVVLVGATTSIDGVITYSGFRRRSRWRPLDLERVECVGDLAKCDTFNGNFVLMPASLLEAVGGFDPAYAHAYGDLDLGYAALRLRVPAYVYCEPIGVCLPNNNIRSAGRVRVLLQLLHGTWGKRDSLQQRLYFLKKHSPTFGYLIAAPIVFARYCLYRLARTV